MICCFWYLHFLWCNNKMDHMKVQETEKGSGLTTWFTVFHVVLLTVLIVYVCLQLRSLFSYWALFLSVRLLWLLADIYNCFITYKPFPVQGDRGLAGPPGPAGPPGIGLTGPKVTCPVPNNNFTVPVNAFKLMLVPIKTKFFLPAGFSWSVGTTWSTGVTWRGHPRTKGTAVSCRP